MSGFIRAITDGLARFDMRSWFTLLLFGLVWKILTMIEETPALLESAPFMQFVGPIGGAGGLLLIASFLYGSNKESAQKSTALAANARRATEMGLDIGQGAPQREKPAVDVNVTSISPYAEWSDDAIREELERRAQVVGDLNREQMLKLLTDLDAQIPTEPRA